MAPTPDLLACPNGVSAETLSALRDELLPAPEATRLRTHAASCHACQARLAHYDELRRALLAQTELEPGERIMAGVRERLAARPVRRLTPGRGMMDGRRRWSGLGALAAAAAVLLLFVDVLGTHPGRQVPIGKVTPRASVTPTATPSLSPVTDVATAWGPHAAVASLSAAIPGTSYIFTVSAVTPDGRYLLGNEFASPLAKPGTTLPGQPAGLLDVATKRFTRISAGTPDNSLTFLQTDGRFVLGYESGQSPATCAQCQGSYWAYDMTTGQLRPVALTNTYQEIGQVLLSAGVLALETNVGMVTMNLETGVSSPLPGIGPIGQASLRAFAWPYLVYVDFGPGSTVAHIRDLQTGADMALHQFDKVAKLDSVQVAMTLDADTLLVAVGSGGVDSIPGGQAMTTLYELDHAMTPGAQLRAVARAGADMDTALLPGYPFTANRRLVLFQGAAWDRSERRFVEFSKTQIGASTATALSGNYFVLFEPVSGGDPVQLAIFDTSRLPVRMGT